MSIKDLFTDGSLQTLNDKQKEISDCSNSTKSRMGHALVASLHSKSKSILREPSLKEMIRRSCSTSLIEGISQLKIKRLLYSVRMEVGDSELVNYNHTMNPLIKRMGAGHIQICLVIISVWMQSVATC